MLRINYKIRWHLLLVHFPVSLFGVAFLFQILHLIFVPEAGCFTLGTNVLVLSGALAMVPTTVSGWATWKHKYQGAGTFLFKRKITTAFVMIWLSVPMTIFSFFFYTIMVDEPDDWAHWMVLTVTLLLISGAVIEGYYGGKLTHRD